MLGWLSAEAALASRKNRSLRVAVSSLESSGRILSATSRSSVVSRASHTSPMPPFPSGLLMTYWRSVVPIIVN